LPSRSKTPGGVPTGRPGPRACPRASPGWAGLGPKSRAWLAGIGIDTPEQLAAQDPFEVWARLKAAQPGVSLNLLYALIGAVERRDWREVARQDRTAILMQLQDMGLV
jgi:DNA transformation protein